MCHFQKRQVLVNLSVTNRNKRHIRDTTQHLTKETEGARQKETKAEDKSIVPDLAKYVKGHCIAMVGELICLDRAGRRDSSDAAAMRNASEI